VTNKKSLNSAKANIFLLVSEASFVNKKDKRNNSIIKSAINSTFLSFHQAAITCKKKKFLTNNHFMHKKITITSSNKTNFKKGRIFFLFFIFPISFNMI